MKGDRTAIIGVGLLGGSLALALKRRKGVHLIGWNHRPSSRRKAARILPVAPSLEAALEGSSTVVLCAHSGSMGAFLKRWVPSLGKGTLVMDVSSVKGAVVREASRVKGAMDHFVPCHPMAGKEKSGPANADAGLYRGRVVFITPLKGSPRPLVMRAVRFWKGVGAHPVILPTVVHDRSVALTSHLPHLLACSLMDLYGARSKRDPLLHKAVGTGFLDFTRIAGGSPAMWSDIMRLNAPEVRRALSDFRKNLVILERELRRGKDGTWTVFFERARARREAL